MALDRGSANSDGQPAVEALLIDFGNVVGFFDHRRACVQLAALSSDATVTANDVAAVLFGDTVEEDFDCGRLTTETFASCLRSTLALDGSDELIAAAWGDIFTPNPAMHELLVELRARSYRLILASNTNEIHFDWIKRGFAPSLALFDALVLSFDVGARKPAPAFYARCVDAAQCGASACLYIDDRADLVAAAHALGIRGLVYDREADVRAALQSAGVLPA